MEFLRDSAEVALGVFVAYITGNATLANVVRILRNKQRKAAMAQLLEFQRQVAKGGGQDRTAVEAAKPTDPS